MYIYIFVDNVERDGSRSTGWRSRYDGRCRRSFGLHEGSYGSWRTQLRITRAGVIVRTMPGLLLVILSRHCTIVSGAILNREIKAKVEWIRGGVEARGEGTTRFEQLYKAYPLISWKLIYIVQRWIVYTCIGLLLSSILCTWFVELDLAKSLGEGEEGRCLWTYHGIEFCFRHLCTRCCI